MGVADCLRKLGWKDSDIANEELHRGDRPCQPERHGQHPGGRRLSELLLKLSSSDESRVELKEGGTKHWVVNTKKALNVRDITKDERFSNSSMKRITSVAGVEPPRSLLIGPVYAESEDEKTVRVIGLVEMVNKKNEKGIITPFSRDDEKLMRMLCHHCSTFITQVEQN